MRNNSVLAAALVVFTVAACSRATTVESDPAPAPVDPVGMYDFTASFGGQTRTGTLEIERTPNGLDGEAWLEGEPDPALADSVVVLGNHVTVYATVGGGNEVVFELDFAGAGFTGVVTADGMTIDLTGTRRGS